MIFVSVGTHEAPFDRLLGAVDRLNLAEPMVVQCGPSSIRPSRATCFEYLSFDEVVKYIRSSRVVVSHAGVGSVMIALANGRRPIVVPRLHRFGEHVDDHQVELGRRMETAGLVTLVEEPDELGQSLVRPAQAVGVAGFSGERWLGDDLREYLTARLESGPALASSVST